uniref:Integrase catalytic domain-containing protein n=1 Tax=Fagus sylvatica TaxID=28930 RepID=A0A2N9H2K3_FAGSY
MTNLLEEDLNPRARQSSAINARKMGHFKRDCPEWKKEKEESSKFVNIVAVDSELDGDMLSVSSSIDDLNNSWLLDSACSFHVTPHKSWFDTYKSVNCSSVRMGNDASCKVIGIGTIKIKMFDNVVRTLGEVRHVPEMKKNLISLGTLDSKGYSYKSEHGIMNVSKGAMVVMRGQKISGNIYKLLGSTILGGVVAVSESEEDDTLLWHMRLGHMSERGCILKLPYTTQKGKLDYVHFDIWGPVKVAFKGGAQYFMSFIDDYSRKVWVYFLKNKSDAFATFKKWKVEAENQTERKLKCLRTDNGTEYRDGQEVDYSLIRIFGCSAYVHISSEDRSKLDPKSKKCIFLGYEKGVKGYKLWDPVAEKVVISRDVVFDEKSMTKVFREDKYQAAESNNSNSRSAVQVELDELESQPEEESYVIYSWCACDMLEDSIYMVIYS